MAIYRVFSLSLFFSQMNERTTFSAAINLSLILLLDAFEMYLMIMTRLTQFFKCAIEKCQYNSNPYKKIVDTCDVQNANAYNTIWKWNEMKIAHGNKSD